MVYMLLPIISYLMIAYNKSTLFLTQERPATLILTVTSGLRSKRARLIYYVAAQNRKMKISSSTKNDQNAKNVSIEKMRTVPKPEVNNFVLPDPLRMNKIQSWSGVLFGAFVNCLYPNEAGTKVPHRLNVYKSNELKQSIFCRILVELKQTFSSAGFCRTIVLCNTMEIIRLCSGFEQNGNIVFSKQRNHCNILWKVECCSEISHRVIMNTFTCQMCVLSVCDEEWSVFIKLSTSFFFEFLKAYSIA